jgi:class 3 adenylate cyclase
VRSPARILVVDDNPVNAARLCAEAQAGDVLASQRVVAAVDDLVVPEALGALPLKGFHRPVPTFRLVAMREPAAPSADIFAP